MGPEYFGQNPEKCRSLNGRLLKGRLAASGQRVAEHQLATVTTLASGSMGFQGLKTPEAHHINVTMGESTLELTQIQVKEGPTGLYNTSRGSL